MTMHANAPLTPPLPTPAPSASSATLPTPPSTPGKPGKVKKMVDSLKRRGSKILGRRASSSSASGLHAGSPRSPRSPARSRSPSPPPGRPVPQRARTTSLVFTSLRLPRKALKRASSARSLRSEETAVDHSRSPTLSSASFSYKDKLSLDVDDVTLSPRMPLATIVSAVEETADLAERFAVPETTEIVIPEEHASIAEEHTPEPVAQESQPVPEVIVIEPVILEESEPEPEPVVASPEPIPEPEPITLAPSPKPEPAVFAPEPEPMPEPTVLTPEPKPEPIAVASAPEPTAAPAPEPIVASAPESAAAPAPAPTVAAPAPASKFVPSWSEYDEYRDIPAFVLPALYVPRVPVRTVLAALVPPFWTLHWWLHPLVPVL